MKSKVEIKVDGPELTVLKGDGFNTLVTTKDRPLLIKNNRLRLTLTSMLVTDVGDSFCW